MKADRSAPPPTAASTVGHADPVTPSPVLDVRGLCVEMPGRHGPPVPIVRDVSFAIAPGETLGLVGESGSGKSTIARAVMGLIPARGRVEVARHDMLRAAAIGGATARRARRQIQMVFQDPGSSLNPRTRLADTVAEPLRIHEPRLSRAMARDRAIAMLERCEIPPALADRLPHQLSGGQRQRVAIARAIVVGPAALVCDEPTSALDVSVQAEVLNLLTDLRREHRLSMLFISHDIGVMHHVAHRIAVLQGGRIVEQGPCGDVLAAPSHEYTRRLLAAVPSPVPA